MLLYINDILVARNYIDHIRNLKNYLKHHYSIKDLKKLKYFLSLKFAYSKKGINMCQRKYTMDLLNETSLASIKPFKTPINMHYSTYYSKQLLKDPNVYRKLIRKLLYLTITRLDITFPVNHLSQFISKPYEEHLKVIIQVIRYLKNSPRQGITFPNDNDLNLYAYCDSN
jgi:hypothetical protein